ncbi:MAG: hypothetical protein M1824_005216 [Vezdaea acicularis]|nr:MAG: hypothetical protein M1824_005216 [Vezdaea acicularis]
MSAKANEYNRQASSLWQKAFATLCKEDRESLYVNEPPLQVLESLVDVVKQKEQLCLDKRWKYRKNGQDIIIRDKLEKITTWVSKFVAVCDVAVQYDPAHAALPWAGIRFLLQATINDSQIFGAMVDGVEMISNALARCYTFEELYLQEGAVTEIQSQLERSISRMYSAVLIYLVEAKKYYAQGTAVRVGKSILSAKETKVDAFLQRVYTEQANVDAYARAASGGLKKRQDTLLKIISDLTSPINRSATQLSELHDHLKEDERQAILNWMSTVPHQSHHRAIGKGFLEGSGKWLQRKDEYIEWRKASTSSILWLHGIPGSGKSRMVYSVIDSLQLEVQKIPTSAPTAFFYCARNESESQRSDPEEILRSILKQLSISLPSFLLRSPVVRAYEEKKQKAKEDGSPLETLTLQECVELILKLLESNPATIIIDALDECNPRTRIKLLEALDDIIQQSANLVKVFVSSRDDFDIVNRLQRSLNVFISVKDNDGDIQRFINVEITRSIKNRDLLYGNVSEELKSEIIMKLQKKAQGMFRWVSLQIEALCDCERLPHQDDVREELDNLPEKLVDSYNVIYQRILRLAPKARAVVDRTIKWLLCAQRPLSNEELIAAVSVGVNGKCSKILEADILTMSRNFVILDSELNVFRFVHLSVREFLETRMEFSISNTNALVLQRCIDLYLFESVERLPGPKDEQDSIRKENRVLGSYATLFWPAHYQVIINTAIEVHLEESIKSFLFKDGQVTQAFIRWLADVDEASQTLHWGDPLRNRLREVDSSLPTSMFLACAFGFLSVLKWLSAAKSLDVIARNKNGRTGLSVASLEGHTTIVELLLAKGTDVKARDRYGETALLRAAYNGHTTTVELLLAQGADLEAKDDSGRTALLWAARKGHTAIVELLLAEGADLEAKDHDGWTALLWAVHNRHTTTVELLLAQGADLKAKDDSGRTALLWAAQKDHTAIVELLLSKGADLEAKDRDGWTALLWAAHNGHTTTHELLLAEGADVKAKSISGLTALLYASHKGHKTIAELLLAKGADLEAKDHDGWTALLWAANNGHTTTVELLLAKGVDVRVKDEYGQTALLMAVHKGQTEIFELLLAKWVDLEAKGEEVSTALLAAVRNGHTGIIELLLAKGADLEAKDEDGWTALLWAVRNGHTGIVELLLAKGADLEAKDHDGWTALLWAAHNGHTTTVELLLAKGADLEAKDHDGWTALLWAVRNGHTGIVELLLAKGADLEAKDEDGWTALLWAVRNGHTGIVELLLAKGADLKVKDEDGRTALHRAVRDGRTAIVELLLAKGAGVGAGDGSGEMTLLVAARYEYTAIVKLLLAQGAHLEAKDEIGQTALLGAAYKGHTEIVELLLAQGADLEARNAIGWTALLVAAHNGRKLIVELLLAKGADVDAKDRNGWTALLGAAYNGHTAIVDLLLAKGVDVRVKDEYGQTALLMAAQKGHTEIVELLQRFSK